MISLYENGISGILADEMVSAFFKILFSVNDKYLKDFWWYNTEL